MVMRNIIVKISSIIVILCATFLIISNRERVTGEEQLPTIKVGVIAPFTGFLASVGEDVRMGILDTNHDGIEYIFEDDACDNTKAISAFKKLVEVDHMNVIIGPVCGGPQEVITPLLKNKNVIALVPSAATEELYTRSGNNFYNMQYALEDESEFIAKRMYELGYKRVAIIHYANAFSDVHTKAFKKHFKGEIVVDSFIIKDDADIPVELLKIKKANVDAVFSTDITFFFAQGMNKMKSFGMTTPIFSHYVTEIPAVRSMVEGVVYSFPQDITDKRGAVYGLSKQSAEFLVPLVKECSGDYTCIKKKIDASQEFTDTGTKKRELILKTITNGEPVVIR